jgi:hypothetical protein
MIDLFVYKVTCLDYAVFMYVHLCSKSRAMPMMSHLQHYYKGSSSDYVANG